MRLTALFTVLFSLALVVPANADDVPESIEMGGNDYLATEGGSAGMTCGGSAGGVRTRPHHELFNGRHYLSSVFTIGCNGFGGLVITRMHTEAVYGASSTGRPGSWHRYSNGVSERGRSSEGTLRYTPFRNGCHINGTANYYRQAVELTVNYTANGNTGTNVERYYLASTSRIRCGGHQ